MTSAESSVHQHNSGQHIPILTTVTVGLDPALSAGPSRNVGHGVWEISGSVSQPGTFWSVWLHHRRCLKECDTEKSRLSSAGSGSSLGSLVRCFWGKNKEFNCKMRLLEWHQCRQKDRRYDSKHHCVILKLFFYTIFLPCSQKYRLTQFIPPKKQIYTILEWTF